MRPVGWIAAAGAWLLTSGTAMAAPGLGTVDDPVRVDAFPYVIAGSTLDGLSDAIDLYDCGPGTDESGTEVIYAFELSAPARVTAWLEGDGGGVDVDVHLLESLAVDRGMATECVARDNEIAEAPMGPGVHYIVVDTFGGDAQAGDFVLHAYAVGEDWFEMPVAQGVVWRARRPSNLAGGPQVLNALHVDLDALGVEFDPVLPPGCATTAQAAAMAGPTAVAAVNSNFFAGCGSAVSFMKRDGVVLATNGAAAARGAFGRDAAGTPMVGRTPSGADWPEVVDGQGGAPLVVEGGEALQGAAAWDAEGLSSVGFLGPNPRTLLGYDTEGDLVLATVDGRRLNAFGMSLDDLAAWSADALDGQGVVNLDGGGSTTMWIRDVTPSGVVNYPSDGGMIESSDHAGSRAVVGAVVIHAEPYNWPPRFQTTPGLETATGQDYAYDADAIDLNVDDVVSYALVAGPPGMVIDPDDGTVTLSATVTSPPQAEVTISASDGRGGLTEQTWTLEIEGGQGPSDTGSADGTGSGGGSGGGLGGGDEAVASTGLDGAGASTDDAASRGTRGLGGDPGGAEGCGCRGPQGGRGRGVRLGALLVLAAIGWRRRRRPGPRVLASRGQSARGGLRS